MIFMVIITLLCIAAALLLKLMNTGEKQKDETKTVSAQDFLNVADIKNNILYTTDGYCITYIRLQPVMLSLWSRNEKRMKTNTLVAELSKDRKPWVLTAVSRPMDISKLVNQYKQMREDTDNPIRKNILKEEMKELQNKVGAGEAVERQFYIKIWGANVPGIEQELQERAIAMISAYSSIGVAASQIKQSEIIQFCNLIHNPSYHEDETTTEPSIPMLKED